MAPTRRRSASKGRKAAPKLTVVCDNRDQIQKLTLGDYFFIQMWLGWFGLVPTLLMAIVFTFLYRESLTWYPFMILSVPIAVSWAYPINLKMQPAWGFKIGEKIMKAAQKYFGLRLCYMDKKAIEESGPAIFLIEPHDVMPVGLFCFSDFLGFNKGHKNVACMSGACFLMPFMRHIYTWAAAESVSKKNVKKLMDQGVSPTICPGGVQEVTMMKPGPKGKKECILYLKSRQGTIRLAMEYGRPICPVFVFGQRGTWSFQILQSKLAQWVGRKIGFAPMVFYGIGGIPFAIPKPCPLTVVFGKLVKIPKTSPGEDGKFDQKTVDSHHQQVLDGFMEVFESYKDDFGMGDITLSFA